jgi:protein SDA1
MLCYKILIPADFTLLNDLRIQAAKEDVKSGRRSKAKRKLATLEAQKKDLQSAQAEDTFISENDTLGPRKKAKATHEERLSSIQKDRERREKFASRKSGRYPIDESWRSGSGRSWCWRSTLRDVIRI